MSAHLSPREISEWTLGERASEAMIHVRECPLCRAAVEELEDVLADFRLAVRETSATRFDAPPAPALIEPLGMRLRPLWRGLAVAGTAFIAFLAAGGPEFPRTERVLTDSAADAALMRQVNAELSQPVPDSMAPLLTLMASDESSIQGRSKILER